MMDQFITIPYMYAIIALFTLCTIICTIYFSRRLPKLFSSIMVMIGIIILFVQGVEFDLLIESITKNLPLVALIAIVPILSIPINLGEYHRRIASFFSKYTNKPTVLYMYTYSFFYLLGPITNLGAIHIIHSMISRMKFPTNFLGRIYPRGFSSINTWAPYFASVFFVVYYLEIPMYQFIPYGILLSLFQFITASTLFKLKEERDVQLEKVKNVGVNEPKKMIELLCALLLLISVVFLIEPFISFNVSVLIILAAGMFAFIWSMYLHETKRFFQQLNDFRHGFMDKQANEIALFLSAGFFGVVLANSPMASYINLLWSTIANFSLILLIMFTIILISLFSFIGIHQIVIVSSILATTSASSLGVHEITFAMMLLSAWAIGSVTSPIAPMNVISSNLLQVNVFHMIFRWNFIYVIILLFVHTFVIFAVHTWVLS